jgi:hypothetical protein
MRLTFLLLVAAGRRHELPSLAEFHRTPPVGLESRDKIPNFFPLRTFLSLRTRFSPRIHKSLLDNGLRLRHFLT